MLDKPTSDPVCKGLMHTVIQEIPLVRVSSAAWYPYGTDFRPCYETWIFSNDVRIKTKQVNQYGGIKDLFWQHYSIVHHVQRHLACDGDKEKAREQYQQDNRDKRKWYREMKKRERAGI
jgi:hypothetical protein